MELKTLLSAPHGEHSLRGAISEQHGTESFAVALDRGPIRKSEDKARMAGTRVPGQTALHRMPILPQRHFGKQVIDVYHGNTSSCQAKCFKERPPVAADAL